MLIEDNGEMLRTWTITSVISHLRAFRFTVRAVNQEDIQSFVVTTELGRQRRAERQYRLSSIAPLQIRLQGAENVV